MIRYISGLFHLLVVVGFFGWLGLVWFFGGFFCGGGGLLGFCLLFEG